MAKRSDDIGDACGAATDTGRANFFACLEKVANDAKDALIVTDSHGQIVIFSAGATSLFGYQPAEILGRDLTGLMHEPFSTLHGTYMRDYLRTGQGRILGIGPRDLPARRKNNAVVPIELSVSETIWQGERYFIAVCRDISSRIAHEQALQNAYKETADNVERLERANRELGARQQELTDLNLRLKQAYDDAANANRAKSDFLAMMSHELRTPLNGIMGMAQMLNAMALNATQREQLDIISQSAATLLALVNDLLDLSKAEAGRMTLEERTIDLPHFIQQIAVHWRHLCELKGLKFNLTVDCGIPPFARFDPVRMKQILDNLLSNALKFTESGTISLAVLVGQQKTPLLRFDVTDTGIGIALDHHDRIFDGFAQANNSITRRFGGTGLGLAICKKLVGLMGGEIGLESSPGQGSHFRVKCPLQTEPGSATQVAKEPQCLPTGSSEKSLRILVAEDNPLNQKVIAAVLESMQCDFTIAGNGREALEQLDTNKFDLVMMDLHMPEMDGLSATRAIRPRGDALGKIPIIGLTASSRDEDRDICFAAGMSAFVAKPFNIRELGDVMAMVTSSLPSGSSERLEKT